MDQNSARIITAINSFSPKIKEGKVIVSPNNFWREPPYFHEEVIIRLWVCLIERVNRGISRQKAEDFLTIVAWVASLTKKQVEAEKPLKRKTNPSILSSDGELKLNGILANFADKQDFFVHQDWRKTLVTSVRALVMTLEDVFIVSIFDAEKKILSQAKKLGVD